MLRGVDRHPIFSDDADRTRLLDRLEIVLPEEEVSCLAWCFMPNHSHFLLRTGGRPLARAMHRIETSYAGYFNRRHGRVGYLFQDRYRALSVTDDAYLLMVLRYIHRNPVEAGIVESIDALAGYPWTGHSVLMGRRTAGFQSVDAVLSWMGATAGESRRRLDEWMRIDTDASPDLSCAVPIESDVGVAPPPVPGSTCPAIHLGALLEEACARLRADVRAVREGRRGVAEAKARALFSHLAARCGVGHAEIAIEVGVSRQAVGGCITRGRALARDLDPSDALVAYLRPDP